MNGNRQEIGWKPFWFMLRGYQIVGIVLAIFLAVTRPPKRPEDMWILVPVGLLLLLVFDMFVRGTASERGITFVRYRNEEFVPWRDVEEVTWSPKAIRIKLRDRHFLRRYLQFPLKNNLKRGLAFSFGGDVQPPDFVLWLETHGYLDEQKIRRHNRWSW